MRLGGLPNHTIWSSYDQVLNPVPRQQAHRIRKIGRTAEIVTHALALCSSFFAFFIGFLYWAYGMPREAAQRAPSSDMARQPETAKNYVLEESCRATCTTELDA